MLWIASIIGDAFRERRTVHLSHRQPDIINRQCAE